jgi:predicted nucleotidyltransferase
MKKLTKDEGKTLVLNNLEKVLELIDKKIEDVISIYFTGSFCFLEEVKDIDVYLIIKNFEPGREKRLIKLNDINIDYFIYDENLTDSLLHFEGKDSIYFKYFILFFPLFIKQFNIFGKIFDIDIMKKEREYKNNLKLLMKQTIDTPDNELQYVNKLSKISFYYIVPLMIYKKREIDFVFLTEIVKELKFGDVSRKYWIRWIENELDIIYSEELQ